MAANSFMKRVNNILNDPEYQTLVKKNNNAETDRIYCSHSFEHMLTTARLTWLFLLEDGCPYISREIAYATGLLHDIGRWFEYSHGGDHAEHSARIALPILNRAKFSQSESCLIRKAILEHRKSDQYINRRSALSSALYKADKHSRICFTCNAADKCNKIDKQPHKSGLEY